MSTLSVLEDAILEACGELPDELCPLYLVAQGRALGGDAAAVAEAALAEHREGWFTVGDLYFEPERVYRRLTRPKIRRALLRVEVASALRWHAQGLQQLIEAWGPDLCARAFSRGVVTEARCSVGTFRVHLTQDEVEWVAPHAAWPCGDAQMYTLVYPPHHDNLPPVTGWRRWRARTAIVHALTEPQRSRRARDAARASRQAEAEMQLGVGR